MTENQGIQDRGLRIIMGSIMLLTVLVGPQTPWGLVGILPLISGFSGYCPLYRILGIRSCGATNGH